MSNPHRTRAQNRALKLSRLGALRRAKAIRRACRLQQRLIVKYERQEKHLKNVLLHVQELQATLESIADQSVRTDPDTTVSSQSPTEAGEGTESESATEATASSESSTTTDPTSEPSPDGSQTWTFEALNNSAAAPGEPESLAA